MEDKQTLPGGLISFGGVCSRALDLLEGFLESNRVKSLFLPLGADGSRWDGWGHLSDNTGTGRGAGPYTS